MGHPTVEVPVSGPHTAKILHEDTRNNKPRYYLPKSSVTLTGSYSSSQFVVVIIFMLIQCALLVNSFVLDEAKLISKTNSSPVRNLNQDFSDVSRVVSDSNSASNQSLVVGESGSNPQLDKANESGCEHEHDDKVEQILLDIFQEEHHDDQEDEELPSSHDSAESVQGIDEDYSPLNIEHILSDDEHDDSDDERLDDEEHQTQRSVSNDDDHELALPRSRRSVMSDNSTEARGFHHHHSHGRKKSNNRHAVQPKRNKRRPAPNRRNNKKTSSSKNVNKYNDYMDVVLKRMNGMIKTKQMDPLMVNLFSGGSNNNKDTKEVVNKKKKKKSSTTRKKRKGAKNRGRSEDLEEEEDEGFVEEIEDDDDEDHHHFVMLRSDQTSDSDEVELDNDHDRSGFRRIRALIINGSMKRSAPLNTSEESSTTTTTTAAPTTSTKSTPTTTTSPSPTKTEQRGFDKQQQQSSSNEAEEPRKSSSSSKNKNSSSKKKNSKPSKSQKEAKKKKQPSQKPTRGVLKGLSSLRRNGNVDVIRQGDKVRIVRANFLLGPVTLEIVPKGANKDNGEGRGKQNKKKKSTVTAIAHQLKGIIEVRLKKNSPTTIKRLRVFPPSSVKIKSSSNKKVSSNSSSSSSVPRYSKVTPVATQRLRQIATAVVRQADVRRKTSELHKDKKQS